MKVQESSKMEQRTLEKMNRDLQTKVRAKEVEIDNTKKYYDKKVEDQKIIGQEKLILENDLTQQKLSEAIDHREERLTQVKNSLDQTKTLLETEQSKLKQDQELKKADLLQNLEIKSNDLFEDAYSQANDINERTNDVVKKMQEDSSYRIDDMKFETHQKVQMALLDQQKTIEEQNSKLQGQNNNLSSEQLVKKTEAQREHEQQLFENKQKYQGLQTQYNTILDKEMQTKQEQHVHLLEKADKNFQQKHEKLLQDHLLLMETTKSSLQEQFDKLIDEHTTKKQIYESKLQDNFYRINTIDPVITDIGDAYKVEIKVPEHEKENVTLSPLKRKLRINMTRRFENSRVDDQGHMDKSSRSEVFSKTVTTDDIMESKGVKQNYENGVLSFIVKKA